MSLINLERVRFRYQDSQTDALDNVDLSLDTGEFVILAGASGSGKSTLCRILTGLVPHLHPGTLEGIISVDGLDPRVHPVHDLFKHVGLVFQNPQAQLFNSTVGREIAFGLESLGLPRSEIRARTLAALQSARLLHLQDRAPHTLSGGEQQTVAVAAILALQPRVLVLDEPFANLDPEAVERIRTLLREEHARGTTIVVAEHRLGTLVQDATRLVVVDQGRIVRDGTPRSVLRHDLSPYRLNIPYVIRVAHESGWDQMPLSVDEAKSLAHGRVALLPKTREINYSPAPQVPCIGARDVVFARNGQRVLNNVNLEIARGECVALVGKNGSGKTTLLKHLNGLYRPSPGSITILGSDTRKLNVTELAKHVGFVFQNPNDQLFKPNVREEIEVAPRALRRFDREWLDNLIAQFDLQPFLERSPFMLSEGEKKRVAFASALAARPEIILLDEPTTGQDLAFRCALERLLRALQSQGTTIVFATHELEFAEEVAPRWIALADGEIVADGTPDEVMHNETTMSRAALHPTARFELEETIHSIPAVVDSCVQF